MMVFMAPERALNEPYLVSATGWDANSMVPNLVGNHHCHHCHHNVPSSSQALTVWKWTKRSELHIVNLSPVWPSHSPRYVNKHLYSPLKEHVVPSRNAFPSLRTRGVCVIALHHKVASFGEQSHLSKELSVSYIVIKTLPERRSS